MSTTNKAGEAETQELTIRDEIRQMVANIQKPVDTQKQWVDAIDALVTKASLDAQIKLLHSIITPIYGDKDWDEPDTYVMNLKGHDILNIIAELEKQRSLLS